MFLYFIVYWFFLIKLKWKLFRKKYLSRFDHYDPHADPSKLNSVGLLPSDNDWQLGTPNGSRNENVTLVASNSYDASSLILILKWRPYVSGQRSIGTLLSDLSIEIGGVAYDYQGVSSYDLAPYLSQADRITQYGQKGSSLRLQIVLPNRRYRLLFRGYMNKRDSPGQKHFVKLNLLIYATSKVYDFKERFDPVQVARMVAAKRPKRGALGALKEIILHDKHEHLVRIAGEYQISQGSRCKLFMWGFHSKLFLDDTNSNNLRCKRILGAFTNGRAFNLGVCENVQNNFDPRERFTTGYGCFQVNPSVDPINQDDNSSEFWNKLSSDSLEVPAFNVEAQGHKFRVSASKRRFSQSSFLKTDLESQNRTSGWIYIQVNDNLTSQEEKHLIEMSRRAYTNDLKNNSIVDPRWSQVREFPSKPYIVSIDESECLYSDLVGSKAASLAKMRLFLSTSDENKFVVPNAFVLTRFVYDEIKNSNANLAEQIRQFEATVGRGQVGHLKADCERLQQMIREEIRVSKSLIGEIENQMALILGVREISTLDGRLFAIRSSSWAEDEDGMSSAGQLDTVLKVGGEFNDLVGAILRCYSSKFSLTNIEYKRQYGLPLDLPMAVIVQEMIECQKAGNMVTCKPTNGDEGEMLIVSALGLGEKVVSGLESNLESIQVEIGPNLSQQNECCEPKRISLEQWVDYKRELKFRMRYLNPGSNDPLDEHGEDSRASRFCSEDDVKILTICSLELACYFQCPQEIEWGFKDGQWYLFQSRPMTGLDNYSKFELLHEGDIPSRAEQEFVTRANLCEVMPYALTPLQVSLVLSSLNIFLTRLTTKSGDKRAWQYSPVGVSMDTLVDSYYVFFCLRGGGLFRSSKDLPLARRAIEIGLFGREIKNEELDKAVDDMAGMHPQPNYFDVAHLKFVLFTSKTIDNVKSKLKLLGRDIAGLRYRSSPGSKVKSGREWSPLEGFINQVKVAMAGGEEALTMLLGCNSASSFADYAILQVLSRYIQDPIKLHATLTKLITGGPGVISAEIPKRIEKMAKLIAKRGREEVGLFVAMASKDALKYVSRDLKDELSQEFDSFMSEFGHRCYNEYSISDLGWRQRPEAVVEMLQVNARRYLTDDTEKIVKQIDTAENALQELLRSLSESGRAVSFKDKLLLKYWLVPQARNFVLFRERAKDLMIRHTDIMRDATRQLGLELCQMNLLPKQELVYYLFIHEIDAFLEGPQPALVFQANQRYMEAQINNQCKAWRFEEIESGHELTPLHRKSSELPEHLISTPGQKLHGMPACGGQVRGRVRLVENFDELSKVEPGDILVTYAIDVAYSTVFPLLAGIVAQVGGIISHGAVVVREFGLPSLMGVPEVTRILEDGEQVFLDADNGLIVRLRDATDAEQS